MIVSYTIGLNKKSPVPGYVPTEAYSSVQVNDPARVAQDTGDDSSTAAGIIKSLKGIINIEVNRPGCCVVGGFRLTERLGQEHFAKCCLPDKKSVYRTRSGREAARAGYYSSGHAFLPPPSLLLFSFYPPPFTLRLHAKPPLYF